MDHFETTTMHVAPGGSAILRFNLRKETVKDFAEKALKLSFDIPFGIVSAETSDNGDTIIALYAGNADIDEIARALPRHEEKTQVEENARIQALTMKSRNALLRRLAE